MKTYRVLFGILMVLYAVFPLYADIVYDEDDFTEYEFCFLDSLRLLQNSIAMESQDSIDQVVREMKKAQSQVEFTYSSVFYISKNTNHYTQSNIDNTLILCDRYTYSQLQKEIVRYAQDIHNVYGCGITIVVLSGGTTADIKELIYTYYIESSISGAVLIGNIPTEFFKNKEEAAWPCDLYYMDLDGIWIDGDGDSILDDHIGDIAPEIFVGRICAKGFRDYCRCLKVYFDKNHLFWSGGISLNKQKALSVVGPDWTKSPQFHQGIMHLYGTSCTTEARGNNFSKDKYITYLQNQDYEFIQLACHSTSFLHAFQKDNSQNLSSIQLQGVDKQAFGYNLFCCKSCNWSRSECIGESYLYSPSNALVVVGSTKSGGMLGFGKFYKPLGKNKSVGDAYKIWWKEYGSVRLKKSDRISWWYGLCILGDPFVQFKYDNQCNLSLNINTWNNQNMSNIHLYSAQNEIVVSCEVPNGKELVLKANSIVLKSGFHAPKGTTAQISIDPCGQQITYRKTIMRDIDVNDTSNQNLISGYYDTAKMCSQQIYIVPNPCKTSCSVRGLQKDRYHYRIYNQDGILTICGLTLDNHIDISMLPNGVYFVKITDGDIYAPQCIKLIIQ